MVNDNANKPAVPEESVWSSENEAVGRELSGDYRTGDKLGRGGCAIVYEGWRKSDNLHVAIKVLAMSPTLDEKEQHIAKKRFYREARLIASLKEIHIVQCLAYGTFDGSPCMVLEYVDGISLDKYIRDYGALSIELAVGIIRQLLLALEVSHQHGIIHRDIKPGNIMIFDTAPPFEIRVFDFGIATVLDGMECHTLMTQQGNIRGTPAYMAPELFHGTVRASAESDIYAAGLVLLECLTGEIAFTGHSFMEIAYKHVNKPIEIPADIPGCLANIIKKCCAKAIEDRYRSARELIDALNANLDEAIRLQENRERPKPKKHAHASAPWLRSKALWLLAASACVVSAVIVLAVFISRPETNTPPPTRTAQEIKTNAAIDPQAFSRALEHAQYEVGLSFRVAVDAVEDDIMMQSIAANDDDGETPDDNGNKPSSNTATASAAGGTNTPRQPPKRPTQHPTQNQPETGSGLPSSLAPKTTTDTKTADQTPLPASLR
ncbi:MAG: serine/threonine protein kinase [Proteobacteria bacterium]|nr:serine/threonine protein kinase [Pseudomonadota bacterium]